MARIARTATVTSVTVMLIASTLGLLPGVASPAQGADEAALSYGPDSGVTGTAITVSGGDCLLPDSTEGADGVVTVLETEAGEHLASTTIPVERDGTFSGELVVPAGTPAGVHLLRGSCVSPELPTLVEYVGGPFEVTGEGDEALTQDELDRETSAGSLAGGIEAYPSYDGQSTCSPAAKPGTQSFADNTMATFKNTGTYGIARDCGIGGVSEHKEGRAWDWKANASNATQHRSVDRMLKWLLEVDAAGNRHAMARRLGIMYIIWDRQMFRMYRPNDGWQPYSGSSPHTDHVHISFTRAGGAKTTSYWSMRTPPPWGNVGGTTPTPTPTPAPAPPRPATASFTQTRRDINRRYIPIPGDFDGDGTADVIWYGPGPKADYIWWGRGRGRFTGVKTTVRRSYIPLAGDFDGDGVDDVLWYGPGRRLDHIWWGGSNRRFKAQSLAIGGIYSPPVVGDFDGDGRDDIVWYGAGTRKDWIWWGGANRRFTGAATNADGTFRPPFTGDFDGDGRDDIYWYGKGDAPDFMWHGRGDRTFEGSYRTMQRSRRPLAGNFNGDRRDDIFWYVPGAPRDGLWLGDRGRGFASQAITNVQGTYDGAFVADLDGNGQDDIYWYAPGPGADYIWWF
jgi:hypothetical protein